MMNSQLQHLKSAVLYLDRTGQITKIREKANELLVTNQSFVYEFPVQVNPLNLTDIDAELGNVLLHQPQAASLLFQEAVWHVNKALKFLPETTVSSQVIVPVQLTCLPLNKYSQLSSVSALLHGTNAARFVQVSGIVTAVTAISSYTKLTRYFCPLESCPGFSGNEYIRIHVPGALEIHTIRNDFYCQYCGIQLNEDKSKRTLADKLVAELVPAEALSLHTGFSKARYQAIPVYCTDPLAIVPQLGEHYDVIGIVRQQHLSEATIIGIEANNIIQVRTLYSQEHYTEFWRPELWNPTHISESPERRGSIRRVLDHKLGAYLSLSPWALPLILAYCYAEDVCPNGAFFKLKLGLLLSLTLCDSLQEPLLLHVLAVGTETSFIHKLYQWGLALTGRCVDHSVVSSLTGRTAVDRYTETAYMIEGGSLILASGGVCNLGELCRYKKSTHQQIQSVLDSKKVSIDIGVKQLGSLPYQTSLALKCQVWAYTDPRHHKQAQHADEFFQTADTGNLSKAMLDVFGIVFFTDCSPSDNSILTSLALQTLNSAMLDPDSSSSTHCPSYGKPSLDRNDFKQFMAYAQSLKVEITSPVSDLLRGYYQTSRRTHTTSVQSSAGMPMSGYNTLLAMCVGHAKLCLHTVATGSDALMAIRLYEEYITARFGCSLLSVQPMPHIIADDWPGFIQQDCDLMKQMHTRLLRFFSASAPHEE